MLLKLLLPVLAVSGIGVACFALRSRGPIVSEPATVHVDYAGDAANRGGGRVEVRGLAAEDLAEIAPAAVLNVHLAEAGPNQPLMGSFGVTGHVLWFQPRFPLRPGVSYAAQFVPPNHSAPTLTKRFSIPVPETTPTQLVAIHPAAKEIPENLLKFYLEFSQPMRRGEVYDRVRLLDPSGNEVDLPFVEFDEELWDATGTRITLLIDPGRIKREVKPLIDLGPVLEAGGSYTLEVDAAWPDGFDQPLAAGGMQPFRVVPALRERINPAKWEVRTPDGNVEVRFDRPFDHAILEHALSVRTAEGERIDGAVALRDADRSWIFTPKEPLPRGTYTLEVAPELEDLAGNRLDRLFDAPEAPAQPQSPPKRSVEFFHQGEPADGR